MRLLFSVVLGMVEHGWFLLDTDNTDCTDTAGKTMDGFGIEGSLRGGRWFVL